MAPALPSTPAAITQPLTHGGKVLTQADIDGFRQSELQLISTEGDDARDARGKCFYGEQPGTVVLTNDLGGLFTRAESAKDAANPKANWGGVGTYISGSADLCTAALQKVAQDGKLLDDVSPYAEILGVFKDSQANVSQLPTAIMNASLTGAQVNVDGKHVLNPTSPMAFDAGYTVGYTTQAKFDPSWATDAQLKAVTEACEAGTQGTQSCAAVGYYQGAKAAAQGGPKYAAVKF